jgi:hypothetical protein
MMVFRRPETEAGCRDVAGTTAAPDRFPVMTMSLSQLLEESFQIAWEYLERTGELGESAAASRFISDTIEAMIRRGGRSRLALSNRAISAYQRLSVNHATATTSGCQRQPDRASGRSDSRLDSI